MPVVLFSLLVSLGAATAFALLAHRSALGVSPGLRPAERRPPWTAALLSWIQGADLSVL